MSLLESKGPLDLDWSNGLTVFFVGHIPLVQSNVVLYELGEGHLGPKVSLQLNAQAELAFEVTDRAHEIAAASMPYGPILAEAFFLLCELAPSVRGDTSTEWQISLSVNGHERAQRKATLDLPTTAQVVQTLGGDLTGARNAAFTIAEFGLVRGPVSDEDKARLLAYAVNKYALKFSHG
jgi:hypothetical protein